MGQLAGIDLHGAGSGAESVGGAGLVAVILVLPLQGGHPFGIGTAVLQLAYLALHGDTHARGEGEAARHAVHLAESALYALVGALHGLDGLLGGRHLTALELEVGAAVGHAVEVVVEHGQRFKALDEALGVVVEDHALVEQSVGVEDGLELLHGLIGLVAPLILHEGSHIAASAVLGLERAVVLLYHQPGHVAHHLLIAAHLALALEALVQDEVVVALKGMAVDAGIGVAVVGNEFLQFHGGLGQVVDVESHILYEAGGAHGARAAHGGENAGADGPVLSVDGGVFGELGRNVEVEVAQALLHLCYLVEQLLVGDALGLGFSALIFRSSSPALSFFMATTASQLSFMVRK